MRLVIPLGILLLSALACGGPSEEPGHGHGHGHGGGHGGGEEEGASVAITRWTEGHELFVELDAPVAGRAFAYHAHVTRLADNHAATSGALTLRFEQGGFAVESHTDGAVARPGIFAAEATAPGKPGTYQLKLSYVDGDERADWDAGEVQVGGEAAVAHPGEAEGEIAFLKEAQWQVPFAVAPARERALAPVLKAAGTARPAPGSTTIAAAPVEGLVAWVDALPVVGRSVRRGERLATLVPAGAAEHWATLQAELTTARIDRDLARAESARVAALEPNALVSQKRVEELRAGVARAEARVEAAERRVSSLTSGGAGAVAIRAPADGTVVAVGADHGEAVGAGAPLVTVSAGPALLIEGRVHARGGGELSQIGSLTVQRGDQAAPVDLLAAGATVLSSRLIYDPRSLSAPVSVLVPVDVGLAPGDLVSLEIGVGAGAPRLAVPRSAVVEINGQDVVFVQKTGESFARRRVALGDADATHVAIEGGIAPGEMVVVVGGFDVHVASLSGALESHRH
jgi:membrane fusion protein, heavy metal efflux system